MSWNFWSSYTLVLMRKLLLTVSPVLVMILPKSSKEDVAESKANHERATLPSESWTPLGDPSKTVLLSSMLMLLPTFSPYASMRCTPTASVPLLF